MDSTVSGNFAYRNGGGIGISGTTTLTNSTISGNAADNVGGGIFVSSTGNATLASTTVTNNTADSNANESGQGGGVLISTGGTLNLKNTIVAGNIDASPTTKLPDCSGAVAFGGYNLVGDGTGCTGLTHALLAGSPAINAGNPATPGGASPACPATDQRGISRPQGAQCDIGAFELVPSTNANLSSLVVNNGSDAVTLSPSFSDAQTTYAASVANGVSSVTVTPTREHSSAAIQVRVNAGSYGSVTSGTASGSLSLDIGPNTIDVEVTAEDGTTKTYTVTVTRVAPACTKTWQGGSGLWSDAAQWSGTSIPTSSSDVCLPAGSYTVTIVSSKVANTVTVGVSGAGSNPTLLVQGNGTVGAATLTAAAGVTNHGTITLDSTHSSYGAYLTLTAGTLTNSGTVNVINPGVGARQISAALNNISGGNLNVNASLLFARNGAAHTNTGTVSIANSQTLSFSTSHTWNQETLGTLKVDVDTGAAGTGAFEMSGDTLNFNGGTIHGRPHLQASTLNLATGNGLDLLFTGSNTLSGNVAAGQMLLVQGNGTVGAATLTSANSYSSGGTITLDSTHSSYGAYLTLTAGTLTNSGTINVINPGVGARQISAALNNSSGGNQSVSFSGSQTWNQETLGTLKVDVDLVAAGTGAFEMGGAR